MHQSVKIGIKNPLTGKYFLIRREDLPGLYSRGLWEAVGGVVEPGEIPDEAVIREINEEAKGIDAYDITFLDSAPVVDEINGRPQETELFMYLGKTTAGTGDVECENSREAGFFHLEDILKMDTVPYLKEFLAKYRERLESY